MREHLINLLFEEFKQYRLVDYLDKVTRNALTGARTSINSIVIDMMGFPKDEHPFGYRGPNIRASVEEETAFKLLDLAENYPQQIEAEDISINAEVEQAVKAALSEHTDWLYQEYEAYKNTL